MKKYLYNILIATLILISASVVNAANEVYYTNKENIAMTEKQYNNLLALGFTERQIERMDEETFQENKDIEAELLAQTKKYQKTTTMMHNGIKITNVEEITEEEAMKEKELQSINPSGTKGASGNYYDGLVDNSIQVVTTKIVGLSNTYMRYKVDNEWLVMPSKRSYDIIGIGIESSKVYIASAIAFREDWLTSGGTHGYLTSCYPKTQSTGGSVVFELPSGSMQYIDSYLYFNVKKNAGVGTITSLYAGGDYAHATATVNPNNVLNHYTVNYAGGIVIDATYANSYQSPSVASASFIGTW